MQPFHSGTLAGIGSFQCRNCDYVVSLEAEDTLPECPGCGGEEFVRASLLFSAPGFAGEQPAEAEDDRPDWLSQARADLTSEPGQYLAHDAGDRVVIVALTREWTRIGRSLAADLRFDDPTVSRRHALVVRQADGVRVLDDRSLNGVFVNGQRVEWHALKDGDEILVGRHSLRFIDTTSAAPAADAQTPSGAETTPA
jgi:pSer/pThr/pTyr-binding forkhead associated (FHA) protein